MITFRPSALQPVDDDGNPIEAYTVKPSISRQQRLFSGGGSGGASQGSNNEPVVRGESSITH